jgi:hypothetical protein
MSIVIELSSPAICLHTSQPLPVSQASKKAVALSIVDGVRVVVEWPAALPAPVACGRGYNFAIGIPKFAPVVNWIGARSIDY